MSPLFTYFYIHFTFFYKFKKHSLHIHDIVFPNIAQISINHLTEKGEKMKTRNKVFIGSGVVVLILVLTGFGLVAAYGPWCDSGRGFRPGFHGRGFHSGFHGKDMSEFVLWRLDKKVEELDLSDDQNEKYEAIKAKIKTRLSEGMDDRKRMMEEFHAEMDKDTPDIAGLAESVKEKVKDVSVFVEENLDLFVEFYNSLDEGQRQRVIDSIRDRMDHHRS